MSALVKLKTARALLVAGVVLAIGIDSPWRAGAVAFGLYVALTVTDLIAQLNDREAKKEFAERLAAELRDRPRFNYFT